MGNLNGVWREARLREAVLAGDEGAWRAWYDEAYAPLEAYVLWRCARLRDLADDVLQETWLVAVRSIRRFRPEAGNFLAWLRGIAANVVRNQLRVRKRHEFREARINPPEATPAESGEGAERIARALDALPERAEAVLRAKYLEGLSVAAIADAWGETPKAVESLLSRARAAFREVYLTLETNDEPG
jgi:RNA polymerase sigma-70 factor (ECF subfamily)